MGGGTSTCCFSLGARRERDYTVRPVDVGRGPSDRRLHRGHACDPTRGDGRVYGAELDPRSPQHFPVRDGDWCDIEPRIAAIHSESAIAADTARSGRVLVSLPPAARGVSEAAIGNAT